MTSVRASNVDPNTSIDRYITYEISYNYTYSNYLSITELRSYLVNMVK